MTRHYIDWERVAPGSARDRRWPCTMAELPRLTAELRAKSVAASAVPSIDPVIYFKLQLVMFFEGLRSERQLMQVVADRLSLRWYLGYDLTEPLPDHSSLARTRERYGLEVFRRFFAATEAAADGGTAPSCPSLFQQAGVM